MRTRMAGGMLVLAGLIGGVAGAVASGPVAGGQDPPASRSDAPPEATPRARFEALDREYQAAQAAWDRRYRGPDDAPIPEAKVDAIGRYVAFPAWEYAPKFLEIAASAPDDPAAVDALIWVMKLGYAVGMWDIALRPRYEKALERIEARHLDDPRIEEVWRILARYGTSGPDQAFLRRAVGSAKTREARGRATLALALTQQSRATIARAPWFDRPDLPPFQVFARGRMAAESLRSFRECDPKAAEDEAAGLFEAAIRDYGDVSWAPARKIAVKDVAEGALRELTTLAVGRPAPEFAGTTVTGAPIALADFRGKVVMLAFWATWCGPCMAEVPGERALAERMAGRPFAIVGINADLTPEAAREAIAAGRMAWPHLYDGPPEEAKVAEVYHVAGFPTTILLDADGIIRMKQPPTPEARDAMIEALVKEREAGAGRAKP